MSSIKWVKKLKGIRFRLTLVYSTLFGLFICIFAFIVGGQYIESGREDFDSALLNYAIDLSNQMEGSHTFKTAPNFLEAESKKQLPFTLSQTLFMVRSIEGEILSRSDNFPKGEEIPLNRSLGLANNFNHRFHSFLIQDISYRGVNLKIAPSSGPPFILQVGTPAAILSAQENKLLLINLITIPVLILISSIAAYVIAENALIPIKTLTDTANSIAAKNLSLRVPDIDTVDEVSELSKTFNNLLERLEKAFQAQEHFVANASHQLNTPLSIIKGELDVFETKERSFEENEKFRKSLREELERLIELVRNMLLASRVESGLQNFIFHEVRLDEVLLATTSRLNIKAKDKRILLRFNMSEKLDPEKLVIQGEKQLLSALFENLMENAIKYSPEESMVGITVDEEDSRLMVCISDEGPGITQEDYQNIVSTRFQRSSKSLIPGTGIGLSIAHQIAKIHNAEIKYRRNAPLGSVFSVHFAKINLNDLANLLMSHFAQSLDKCTHSTLSN